MSNKTLKVDEKFVAFDGKSQLLDAERKVAAELKALFKVAIEKPADEQMIESDDQDIFGGKSSGDDAKEPAKEERKEASAESAKQAEISEDDIF